MLSISVSVCKVWDNCVLGGWSLEFQEQALVEEESDFSCQITFSDYYSVNPV